MFSFKAQYFYGYLENCKMVYLSAWLKRNIMSDISASHIWHKVLNLKTSRSCKETGGIDFNNIFYLI